MDQQNTGISCDKKDNENNMDTSGEKSNELFTKSGPGLFTNSSNNNNGNDTNLNSNELFTKSGPGLFTNSNNNNNGNDINLNSNELFTNSNNNNTNLNSNGLFTNSNNNVSLFGNNNKNLGVANNNYNNNANSNTTLEINEDKFDVEPLTKRRKLEEAVDKSGLVFPVPKMYHLFKEIAKTHGIEHVSIESGIYISSVCEYLAAEVLEISGNCARDNYNFDITERDIKVSCKLDTEFVEYEKNSDKTILLGNEKMTKFSPSNNTMYKYQDDTTLSGFGHKYELEKYFHIYDVYCCDDLKINHEIKTEFWNNLSKKFDSETLEYEQPHTLRTGTVKYLIDPDVHGYLISDKDVLLMMKRLLLENVYNLSNFESFQLMNSDLNDLIEYVKEKTEKKHYRYLEFEFQQDLYNHYKKTRAKYRPLPTIVEYYIETEDDNNNNGNKNDEKKIRNTRAKIVSSIPGLGPRTESNESLYSSIESIFGKMIPMFSQFYDSDEFMNNKKLYVVIQCVEMYQNPNDHSHYFAPWVTRYHFGTDGLEDEYIATGIYNFNDCFGNMVFSPKEHTSSSGVASCVDDWIDVGYLPHIVGISDIKNNNAIFELPIKNKIERQRIHESDKKEVIKMSEPECYVFDSQLPHSLASFSGNRKSLSFKILNHKSELFETLVNEAETQHEIERYRINTLKLIVGKFIQNQDITQIILEFIGEIGDKKSQMKIKELRKEFETKHREFSTKFIDHDDAGGNNYGSTEYLLKNAFLVSKSDSNSTYCDYLFPNYIF